MSIRYTQVLLRLWHGPVHLRVLFRRHPAVSFRLRHARYDRRRPAPPLAEPARRTDRPHPASYGRSCGRSQTSWLSRDGVRKASSLMAVRSIRGHGTRPRSTRSRFCGRSQFWSAGLRGGDADWMRDVVYEGLKKVSGTLAVALGEDGRRPLCCRERATWPFGQFFPTRGYVALLLCSDTGL